MKITQLTELTTPADADLLAIVDDVGGSPITKKISVENLRGSNSFIFNESLGTGDGSTVAFDTDNTFITGSIWVYRDGQLMTGGGADYTETDTNTITFTTAPVTGSVLVVSYLKSVTASGNADTLDGFHASSTPTAGQIPVLDSAMAMIGNSMARQAIINGNFDVWQRGTTLTAATGFIADRWGSYHTADGGTLPTLVQSRQLLTSGDIPNAFYHFRLAPNGAGSSLGNSTVGENYQKIEHGTRLLCGNGKKVTVSFWARASVANKRIGIILEQTYGTTGSPSADEVINGTNFTLTSSWVKYTHTFTTNTLSGKTFGTDNNDSLTLGLWYAWGSTLQSRFGSASAENYGGSGTIDIAQVQLCAGDVALPFMPKSFDEELRACLRYYQKSYTYTEYAGAASTTGISEITIPAAGTGTFGINVFYKVPLRATITPVLYDNAGTINKVFKGAAGKAAAVTYQNEKSFTGYTTDATSAAELMFHWTADAEL